MSVFRYPTYKIRIAPDSQKTQGLQAGDIIRRQYAERERTVYSLMCVTETGTELVGDKDAPYFIGALLDGDEPQGGELLDFVRITNLFDTARSGALYLTASDSDSPYMDVIDGMATERSLCYPVMDGGHGGSAGQVQVRRLWQHAANGISGCRFGSDTHCPHYPQRGTGRKRFLRADADIGRTGRIPGAPAGIVQGQVFQNIRFRTDPIRLYEP